MPVVTDNAVFVGSCSGTFYGFNKRSGQILWTYDIKKDGNQSSFHGNILISGKRILVGTDRGLDLTADGHIYAFDTTSGKPAWKYTVGTGVSTDLLIDRSRLIAYCGNGELIALDVRSGKLVWKHKITEPDPDRYLPSPVLVDHTIIAATSNGEAVAIRVMDGRLRWHSQLAARGYLQPVLVGQEIYVLSSAKYIYRLEKDTGRVAAKKDLPASPSFVPAQSSNSILVEFSDQILRCIRNDEVSWSVKMNGKLTTHKPFILQNQVITADATGRLSAWGLEDGTFLWSTVFEHLKAPITTVGGDAAMLYVGTEDGILFGVDLPKVQGGRR